MKKSDVLYLPVKAVYYNQIVAGKKQEEFRITSDFWRKRLEGKDFKFVEITLGYPSKRDQNRRIRFNWNGYKEKTIRHQHFGNDPVTVFAINLRGGIAA